MKNFRGALTREGHYKEYLWFTNAFFLIIDKKAKLMKGKKRKRCIIKDTFKILL